MTNSLFYRARADEAFRAAGESDLANVRERCLRAAAAWEVMADRARRMDRHREEEVARRARRQADAAESVSCGPMRRARSRTTDIV